MKYLFLLLVLVFFSLQSFSSEKLNWSDIQDNGYYVLNQTITFDGIAELQLGEQFLVTVVIAGEGVSSAYIQAEFVDCKKPELEADMIFVNPSPEDTSHNRSVGVALQRGCRVGIWVDLADFYTASLFNDAAFKFK